MPVIAIDPIILTDVKLTLGTNDYEAHVSKVEFAPTASVVVWKGLTPTSTHSFPTRATWVCNLDFAQDWETVNSLSQYLFENEGDQVVATFEPVDGGAGFTANLLLTPGSIGGTVDQVPTSTVSLGVNGKPVLVPAA
jgi:hypothetical protein